MPMFSFLSKGGRVAGETLGVLEAEPEEVLEEQPDQTEAEKPLEITGTYKQVGPVKPYVKDPQKDLDVLVELFGNSRGIIKHIEFCCPDCGHEGKVPYQPLNLDDPMVCNECDFEGDVGDFYDGTVEELHTSRTPTTEELCKAVGSDSDSRGLPDFMVPHITSRLKKYYGVLLGEMPLVKEGQIDAGIIRGNYLKHCNEGCKERGCFCTNGRMEYFGTLQPIRDEPEQTSDESYELLIDDPWGTDGEE